MIGGLLARRVAMGVSHIGPAGSAAITNDTFLNANQALTVNLPTGITASDLLVMAVAQYTGSSSYWFIAPSGWTVFALSNVPSAHSSLGVFTRVASGAEGSTVSVGNGDSSSSRASAVVQRFAGGQHAVAGPQAIGGGVSGSTITSTDPGTMTHTGVWVTACSVAGQSTAAANPASPPAGTTLAGQSDGGGFNTVGCVLGYDTSLTYASTDPGTRAYSIGGGWSNGADSTIVGLEVY